MARGAVNSKREPAAKSRAESDRYLSPNPHEYFQGIALARSVVRRVFQIVDECAKERGLEGLPHQVLIQIFGSPAMELPVGRIGARLNITQSAASRIVKHLEALGFVERRDSTEDLRITNVRVTAQGRALLRLIEGDVHERMAYFARRLADEEREQLTSIFPHFLGVSPKY